MSLIVVWICAFEFDHWLTIAGYSDFRKTSDIRIVLPEFLHCQCLHSDIQYTTWPLTFQRRISPGCWFNTCPTDPGGTSASLLRDVIALCAFCWVVNPMVAILGFKFVLTRSLRGRNDWKRLSGFFLAKPLMGGWGNFLEWSPLKPSLKAYYLKLHSPSSTSRLLQKFHFRVLKTSFSPN